MYVVAPGAIIGDGDRKSWDARGPMIEGREGGGGGPNPISQVIVFFKSQPVLLKLKSHKPFFYCFFFHESQSQCTKSHFTASKKSKSQLPFYPFTTLMIWDNFSIFRTNSAILTSYIHARIVVSLVDVFKLRDQTLRIARFPACGFFTAMAWNKEPGLFCVLLCP